MKAINKIKILPQDTAQKVIDKADPKTTFPAIVQIQTSEMSSTKRKAPSVELQRRVRARRESSEEFESVPSLNVDDPAEEHSENSDPDSDSNSEEDEVCLRSESQNRLVANP